MLKIVEKKTARHILWATFKYGVGSTHSLMHSKF